MTLYENVFLFSGNLTEKLANDKISVIEQIIKKNKGSILKKEYWGLRSLAYKIKKNSKAHYFMLNTENNYDTILEIKKKLSIDEDYLRLLNLKISEFDKNPSIIFKSK
tara:strand:+ start:161 stop:484 length:324 start_codon:yes stop_codon:yes gene_type:complete